MVFEVLVVSMYHVAVLQFLEKGKKKKDSTKVNNKHEEVIIYFHPWWLLLSRGLGCGGCGCQEWLWGNGVQASVQCENIAGQEQSLQRY